MIQWNTHTIQWNASGDYIAFLLRMPLHTRSMYALVPKVMAQFFLKIEKLSHIMGTAPILEMACAYGLRPRLWLLIPEGFYVSLGWHLEKDEYEPYG